MSSLPIRNKDDNEATIFRSCLVDSTRYNTNQTNHSLMVGAGSKNKHRNCPSSVLVSPEGSTRNEKTAKVIWNVRNISNLPDAANIFPLERTRVSVDYRVSTNVIGQRICDCLKDLSISIISKRSHKLLVESLDRDVRFYINLYKEKSDNCESNDGDVSGSGYRVMVELQKRRGSSISFSNMARNIMQAAKTGHYALEEKEEGFPVSANANAPLLSCPQPKKIVLETNEFNKTERDEMDSLSYHLKCTADMIKDERMDANLLGMENLVLLTNTFITNHATALGVAKLILGDNEGDSNELLGFNELIKHFICGDFHNRENIWDDSFEHWYFSRMHYYALTVLANSMNIWAKYDGGLMFLQSVICTGSWLEKKDGVLSALIDELADTEMHQHDAYQAMRCLNIIFQVSPLEVCMKAIEWGASSAIYSALDIGRCSHSLLERESEITMKSSINAMHKPMVSSRGGLVECAA